MVQLVKTGNPSNISSSYLSASFTLLQLLMSPRLWFSQGHTINDMCYISIGTDKSKIHIFILQCEWLGLRLHFGNQMLLPSIKCPVPQMD